MSTRRNIFSLLLIYVSVTTCTIPAARAGDEWPAINPAELQMTSEPLAPGAPANYLYRKVDRDDSGRAESQTAAIRASRELNYVRIKVFTEEGRRAADVEIRFVPGYTSVNHIQGRTIHPDGTVVNFDGKVYE